MLEGMHPYALTFVQDEKSNKYGMELEYWPDLEKSNENAGMSDSDGPFIHLCQCCQL